jgi:hypothetical protein
MNRLKYLSVVLFAAILAVVVITACNKDKTDAAAEGKEAGEAMCGCVSGYTAPNPEDFEDMESFQAAFMAYAGQLYNCLGEIAPYSKYVVLAGTQDDGYGYNPNAAEPLYSIFTFKNDDFGKEFKKATEVCMLPFAALFAMMGG